MTTTVYSICKCKLVDQRKNIEKCRVACGISKYQVLKTNPGNVSSCEVWSFLIHPHFIIPGKDNSLQSSGRGCMVVALATRSTISDCVTASFLESIMAKASRMHPFMLIRSK